MAVRRPDRAHSARGRLDLPRPRAGPRRRRSSRLISRRPGHAAADRAASARRGRARLITAAKSDNNATIAAARFTYRRLLSRGVEIYEYRATKLHTKLVVLDDVVHIGSSNLDIRSLYLNMELMLRVDDATFAR